MEPLQQLKAGRIKERVILNKVILIATIFFIVALVVLITLALTLQFYILFIFLAVLVLAYVLPIVIVSSNVRKKEERIECEKFRKIVDSIVLQEEYELPVLDVDLTIKVTPKGFVIDDELFGFDNFDVFMGTSKLFRQASIAFFVVSNFSPYSDDKTYPINFAIGFDGKSLGCAKQYFFESDYKAFNFVLENPEESAKEILKYGMLKVQIEEQNKQKQLDKLARELSNY
ncbi:MAG: hypothetical protein E7353_02610 [Clostridiales bacterium]|nr:hypothetical protein [Clostridiales bacterium]